MGFNFSKWAGQKYILLGEDNFSEETRYILSNPQKCYLLPVNCEIDFAKAILCLGEMSVDNKMPDLRIAQNISFSNSVFIRINGKDYSSDDLWGLLNHLPADSLDYGFQVILPEGMESVSGQIQRQLNLLRISGAVRTVEEVKNHDYAVRLKIHAEELLLEIANVRAAWREHAGSGMRSAEASEIETGIMGALTDIESHIKFQDAQGKLLIIGDSDGCISHTMSEDFFVSNIPIAPLDEETRKEVDNADCIIVLIDASKPEYEKLEVLLSELHEVTAIRQVIFAVCRSVQDDMPVSSICIMNDILTWLDNRGYEDAPLFFLDACDILLQDTVVDFLHGKNEIDIEKILNLLDLEEKKKFWAKKSLENIQQILGNVSWIHSTGICDLKKYCQGMNRLSENHVGQLVFNVSDSLNMLKDAAWNKFIQDQDAIAENTLNELEILHDRLALHLNICRRSSDDTAKEAALYESVMEMISYIKDIRIAMEVINTNLWLNTNFDEKDMDLLYKGNPSPTFMKVSKDCDEKLNDLIKEKTDNLNKKLEAIINKYYNMVKSDISSLEKFFSEFKINIVQKDISDIQKDKMKISLLGKYNEFFLRELSLETLISFSRRNTEIICENESIVPKDKKSNTIRVKRYYLVANFRKCMRDYISTKIYTYVNAQTEFLMRVVTQSVNEQFGWFEKWSTLMQEDAKKEFRHRFGIYLQNRNALIHDIETIENIRRKMSGIFNIWKRICA